MRKRLLVYVAPMMIVAACGGGPTAPASPGLDTKAAVTTTEPAAPAPTPAPVPTPGPTPAPTPTPTPPPTPAPSPTDGTTRYTARVDTIRWYGTPVFTSPTFEVVRYADRVTLGTVSLPIVFQDDRNLIARTSEMSFTVVDDGWTFNGIPGSGSGTWSKQ